MYRDGIYNRLLCTEMVLTIRPRCNNKIVFGVAIESIYRQMPRLGVSLTPSGLCPRVFVCVGAGTNTSTLSRRSCSMCSTTATKASCWGRRQGPGRLPSRRSPSCACSTSTRGRRYGMVCSVSCRALRELQVETVDAVDT